MTPTEEYVVALGRLKPGELGLLRAHRDQRLDQSVAGFDLFAGIWWPLRSKSQRTPRRSVAWLIAKVYACYPITLSRGDTLARQLGRCSPPVGTERRRFRNRFDRVLTTPLDRLEPELRWAVDRIASDDLGLDWVQLTDDLSAWEQESIRVRWAKQFSGLDERR